MPKKVTKKPTAKKNIKKYSLKTWLFNTPLMFALTTFFAIIFVTFLYAIIAAVFNTAASQPLAILLVLTFVWAIYYMIKKLPHDDMHRDDFVAITNGCNLICLLIPFIALSLFGYNINMLQYKLTWLYVFHPVFLWILGIFGAILYLYVFGVAISNIYAKFKRAAQIGISKKLIIASMPFAFLLMWTPGYLITDKKHDSNLNINCRWYKRFNDWVVNNATNTLVTFLVFVLLMNVFSGPLSLLLTGCLLIIYALWNLRYKTKFMKNINTCYAWTAVAINISVLLAIMLRALMR